MTAMRYGSICSGVEAASLAWEPLGWQPQWFAEIERFPAAILAHHWPEVENLGDITDDHFTERTGAIDLLVGGTPCQSFSVAGLRGGLDDDRGNLALRFCQIALHLSPRWIVWENVPGVLSSNGGRDFGSILGALVECGYGFAYRILDAQFFGVAQRRRRVFVVGHLGDWRPPAAVLFERKSLLGHTEESAKARQEVARDAGGGVEANGHWGGGPHPALSQSHSTGGIGMSNQELFTAGGSGLVSAKPLVSRMTAFGQYVDDGTVSTIKERDYKDATDLVTVNAREDPIQSKDQSLPLRAASGDCGGGSENLLASTKNTLTYSLPAIGTVEPDHIASTMTRNSGSMGETQLPALVQRELTVRRLTPTECERLQGMPDNHTRIPWRNKPAAECPDGPRYKAIGNSMAVPVMRWIGERIETVERILKKGNL